MPVKSHKMQKLKLAVVFLKKWHERRWCGRIICCYFRPQCSHSTLFLFLSLSLPFVIRLFLPARLFSLQPVCCSTHCMLILDSACTHGCWQKKVGLIVCVHSRVCACVGGGGGMRENGWRKEGIIGFCRLELLLPVKHISCSNLWFYFIIKTFFSATVAVVHPKGVWWGWGKFSVQVHPHQTHPTMPWWALLGALEQKPDFSKLFPFSCVQLSEMSC